MQQVLEVVEQQPIVAVDVSGTPLQHGTQLLFVELGLQDLPVVASQQPPPDPHAQPHCFAPSTPQQPRSEAAFVPTLEHLLVAAVPEMHVWLPALQ